MNYRGHRYLEMSAVTAAQVWNVKIFAIFGSQKQLFLCDTDLCKLWLCRVIHIYLCLSEVNASKGSSLFYRSYPDKYIDSTWYCLGTPCNVSHKLKLIFLQRRKNTPKFEASLLSKRHRNFPQNSNKDGNTTYWSRFPLSHFFSSMGCALNVHIFCACVTRVFTTMVFWERIWSLAVWRTRQTD